MANLPPMCTPCYDLLGELYGLHEQLLEIQGRIQTKTEMAREVVTRAMMVPLPDPRRSTLTLASPRQEFYSRVLSSGMSKEEVEAVTNYVDNLHDKIIAEASEKKKVIFPGCLSGGHFACGTSISTCEGASMSSKPIQPIHPGPAGPAEEEVIPPFMEGQKTDEDADADAGESDDDDIKYENEDEDQEQKEDMGDNTMTLSPEGIFDDVTFEEREDNGSPAPPQEPLQSSSCSSSSEWKPSSDTSPSPSVTRRSKRKRKRIPESSRSTQASKKPHVKSKSRKIESSKSRLTTSVTVSDKKSSYKRKSQARAPVVRPLVSTEEGTSQHCDLCGILFPSSEITAHLEAQHHVQDYIAECPNPSCPYVFSCRAKLESHLRAKTKDYYRCLRAANLRVSNPELNCPVCPFRTMLHFRVKFRQHLQEAHESLMDDEEKSTCPIPDCSERFGLQESIDQHLFLHDEHDHRRRPPKVVTNEEGVRETIRQTCDLCRKAILLPDMVQHLEGHQVKDFIAPCPIPTCPFVFSCFGKLRQHLCSGGKCSKAEEAKKYKVLKCEACDLETINWTTFRPHIREHEAGIREKTLVCPIQDCPDKFALRQSLEEHLFRHDLRPGPDKSSGDLKQTCSECKELINIEDMANHLKEAHQSEQIIPCRQCPFLFPTWESLLDHLYEHSKGIWTSGGLSCDLCDANNGTGDTPGIKFVKYESLRQHFFNVHKIGNQFICEHCEREFYEERALSSHKERKHSTSGNLKTRRNNKRIKCEFCPNAGGFYSVDDLLTHNIKAHGAPPVNCKFCSETFSSVGEKRRHERVAHLGLGRSYKCRVEGCGKVYPTMRKCRTHEHAAHNPDPDAKLFVCDTCGKGYNSKGGLRDHVNRHHLGKKEPRRICDVCGESFSGRATLKTHKLIHTGEMPYKCSECNQAFRHRSVLLTHLKGHREKGDSFKPNGPMKNIRKRTQNNL